MKWTSIAAIGCAAAALGMFALAPSTSQAGKPWHSVMADQDFTGECQTIVAATTNPANPGGVSCYSTTQFVPGSANVLRIAWSTQGDTHDGAALEIGCVISDSTGARFCNPGGTGAAPGQYLTKSKLPVPTATTNCNDGGGGAADCHDNSVEATWCVDIVGDDVFTVDFRIATSNAGDRVFVENSYFYIDSSKLDGGCNADGVVN